MQSRQRCRWTRRRGDAGLGFLRVAFSVGRGILLERFCVEESRTGFTPFVKAYEPRSHWGVNESNRQTILTDGWCTRKEIVLEGLSSIMQIMEEKTVQDPQERVKKLPDYSYAGRLLLLR